MYYVLSLSDCSVYEWWFILIIIIGSVVRIIIQGISVLPPRCYSEIAGVQIVWCIFIIIKKYFNQSVQLFAETLYDRYHGEENSFIEIMQIHFRHSEVNLTLFNHQPPRQKTIPVGSFYRMLMSDARRLTPNKSNRSPELIR